MFREDTCWLLSMWVCVELRSFSRFSFDIFVIDKDKLNESSTLQFFSQGASKRDWESAQFWFVVIAAASRCLHRFAVYFS